MTRLAFLAREDRLDGDVGAGCDAPRLDDPCELETYEKGTWGPKSADNLVKAHGGWREPWLPE